MTNTSDVGYRGVMFDEPVTVEALVELGFEDWGKQVVYGPVRYFPYAHKYRQWSCDYRGVTYWLKYRPQCMFEVRLLLRSVSENRKEFSDEIPW